MITTHILDASTASLVPDFIYKLFGYTFPHPSFYDEEELLASHAAGGYYSVLGLGEDFKVISIMVMVLGFPSPSLGFMDLIATDSQAAPLDRACAISKSMAVMISAVQRLSKEHGLKALVSTETTIHMKSQRMMDRSSFFKPSGLFLGWMPGWSELSKLSSSDAIDVRPRRNSTVSVFQLKTRSPNAALHYFPSRFAHLLRLIYSSLDRQVQERHLKAEMGASPTEAHCSLDHLRSYAIINVPKLGPDCCDVVGAFLERFCSGFVQLIHIAISLTEPRNELLTEFLISRGCRYGALLPQYFPQSDALILQRINYPIALLKREDLCSSLTQQVFDTFSDLARV